MVARQILFVSLLSLDVEQSRQNIATPYGYFALAEERPFNQRGESTSPDESFYLLSIDDQRPQRRQTNVGVVGRFRSHVRHDRWYVFC